MLEPQEDHDRFRVIVRHAVGAALVVPMLTGAILEHGFHLYRRGSAEQVRLAIFVIVDWCGALIMGQWEEAAKLQRPARCVGPSIALYAVLRAALLGVIVMIGAPGRVFAWWTAHSLVATAIFAWLT